MKALNESEISAQMAKNPAWQRKGNEIHRNWKFKTYQEAVAFTNKVASLAEREDHHPDILLQYGSVSLSLSTHDAGGLSERDFRFASLCNDL